ncbi:MAG TPA: toprim domain-containing protein [Patescibacteria group bacterium]|nr:toprim domain-containing protein [Patescibacteria group bacterium]
MDKYQEIVELLNNNNVEFREHGDELNLRCIFNDCDADSHGGEAHLYVNKVTGLYDCKKCNERGNLVTLKRHFGVETPSPKAPKRLPVSLDKQAAIYHDTMPNDIREYLRSERLLSDDIIDHFQLGYMQRRDGNWITIPVTDRDGNVLFMKLRQDPYSPSENQPKYMSTGGEASIFNAQILKNKPDALVVCEGEFDCMVLHSMGVPAICSTAGAGTFKPDWIRQLDFVRELYIVMDNDKAGRDGTKMLQLQLEEQEIDIAVLVVTLPDSVGEKGDITDFFRAGLGTVDDIFTPSGKYVEHAYGPRPIDVRQFDDIPLSDVVDTLGLTIKHDNDNKLIAFLCMLSAYTDSSQINVSFNAPSSTGKTFTATQVAALFPEADKIELSDASPTAFFHGEGVYDKERGAKIVSLERKILLLYEQPNPLTQQKLRAVLSHDQRELHYRITNKDKKGANRAELIIIRGFPSTVFCSSGMRLDEQETTRAILLSPEVTTAKIRKGVSDEALRSANRTEYRERLESQPQRIALKDRILAIKREAVDDIIVPNPDEVVRRFNDQFKKPKARHMRDMNHLMNLIKSAALLNVWHRRSNGLIVANQADIDQVFELWGRLIEAQDMNVPPAVMNLYKMYILPAYLAKFHDPDFQAAMEKRKVGLSRQELGAYYFRKVGSPLNDEHLRKQILPQLEASGIITQQKPEEGDKRSLHIFPVWYPKDIKDPFEPNYTGDGGGDIDLGDDAYSDFMAPKK